MSEVKVDTISERTAAGGVTIDGVLIKDGVATFQTPAGSPLVFEGATANAFETTFAITDPTADRTITFPDSSFTVPTAGGLFSSYAVIVDQKSTTTDGGTFTAGSWQTRDLNTEIADPDTIVTITANQFILGAGTYFIRWSAPAAAGIDHNTFIYRHQSRLYDVTGTAEVQPGSPEYLGFYGVGVIGGTNRSVGVARVAPSGTNTYSIQHRCGTTMADLGFGVAGDFTVEEYTIVEIYKES